MTRPKRTAAIVLLALVVVAVVLGIVNRDVITDFVMTKRVEFDNFVLGQPTRGWRTVPRWSEGPPLSSVEYYVSTGYKAKELRNAKVELRPGEFSIGEVESTWTSTGTVRQQRFRPREVPSPPTPNPLGLHYWRLWTVKLGPPWWVGCEDQTEPPAPWM